MTDFDRSLCNHLPFSQEREWLVTNGIGGFASGTIAGILTRRYHGILIAALQPPLGRTLLVSKTDETVVYDEKQYALFTNQWGPDDVEPNGYQLMERFWLEGSIPTWLYAFGDAYLKKRIWMEQGANTTYVQYSHMRGMMPMTLHIKVLINYRDYHGTTHPNDLSVNLEKVSNGLKVVAHPHATPFYLYTAGAHVTPDTAWIERYYRAVEVYRGFEETESHYQVGYFSITLQPFESVTLIATTEPDATVDGESAYQSRLKYENQLVRHALPMTESLVRAADQFIVNRPTPNDPDGRTIIAGYPWFSDWGRDTMISLPGLTLTTKRYEVARSIIETFAQFVSEGMLPNRFPDAGETPEYNTVDATLWYFEAIRAYIESTQDLELLTRLYPILQDIIEWHQRGTRYNIKLDPTDGLIYAGVEGVQLTWMDAKVGDWVVTPRIGKPIEISALWYNALKSMEHFATLLDKLNTPYAEMATLTQTGFQRFWNADKGYFYDVLESPSGHDAQLRPNQIFAVALPYSPLDTNKQKIIVDVCTRHLLTPHGLRSLAAHENAYVGVYGGDIRSRDGAYHQGTVWGWLIGPFVAAHFRVYQDKVRARSFLLPLIRHLNSHGVGSQSEIFDGDAPFTPRGCIAQAWTVAEVLRMWVNLNEI